MVFETDLWQEWWRWWRWWQWPDSPGPGTPGCPARPPGTQRSAGPAFPLNPVRRHKSSLWSCCPDHRRWSTGSRGTRGSSQSRAGHRSPPDWAGQDRCRPWWEDRSLCSSSSSPPHSWHCRRPRSPREPSRSPRPGKPQCRSSLRGRTPGSEPRGHTSSLGPEFPPRSYYRRKDGVNMRICRGELSTFQLTFTLRLTNGRTNHFWQSAMIDSESNPDHLWLSILVIRPRPHLEQADHWPQGVHSGQLLSLHSLLSSPSPSQSPGEPEHFRLLTASPSPQLTLQPAGDQSVRVGSGLGGESAVTGQECTVYCGSCRWYLYMLFILFQSCCDIFVVGWLVRLN